MSAKRNCGKDVEEEKEKRLDSERQRAKAKFRKTAIGLKQTNLRLKNLKILKDNLY